MDNNNNNNNNNNIILLRYWNLWFLIALKYFYMILKLFEVLHH